MIHNLLVFFISLFSRSIFGSMNKSKKRSQYNYSSNEGMNNICKLSINLLKKNTLASNYTKYKQYVKSLIRKFKTSSSTLPILNSIFNIKNKTHFTTIFKEQPLDKYNKIPPFIEIFKFLITKQEFINKFSTEEIKQLQLFLSTIDSSTNKDTNKDKDIYKFLSKSKLGDKLSSNYYYLNDTIKNELAILYPSVLFHSLLINSYTSFEIIQDLEANIKKLYTFSIVWKGKKIDNLLYLYMYNNKKSENNIKKIGTEIIKRILFFNEFLQTDKLPSKFIVFLTDNKKEIDEDVINKMHFKTLNINTAVTNGLDIIIYRQEELLKSIFHELIHFHNLDFRTTPSKLISYLMKTHNIKPENKYTLFESVTESLANILNNIFQSKDIKQFESNLESEIMFSTIQIAKILSICGYKKWKEFAKVDIGSDSGTIHNHNHNKHNPYKQFTQDSCVFSYYILKFYIMLSLDIYFKNCLDTKLKFIQTEHSFNKLIELFDSSRHNKYLENIINNILDNKNNKFYNNKINNNKIQTKIQTKKHSKIAKRNITIKTLRMTCLENDVFAE